MNRKSIVFYLALIFLTACSERALYEKEMLIAESWNHNDPLTLSFTVDDVTQKFNLDLFVEHNANYSFQNIYANVVTEFPDGKKTESIIPIDLTNKAGAYHGKCNGEHCKLRVFLVQGFKFKDAGEYKISVYQESREPSLKGIDKMRLALFENK